jgi:hypothetical protein
MAIVVVASAASPEPLFAPDPPAASFHVRFLRPGRCFSLFSFVCLTLFSAPHLIHLFTAEAVSFSFAACASFSGSQVVHIFCSSPLFLIYPSTYKGNHDVIIR